MVDFSDLELKRDRKIILQINTILLTTYFYLVHLFRGRSKALIRRILGPKAYKMMKDNDFCFIFAVVFKWCLSEMHNVGRQRQTKVVTNRPLLYFLLKVPSNTFIFY